MSLLLCRAPLTSAGPCKEWLFNKHALTLNRVDYSQPKETMRTETAQENLAPLPPRHAHPQLHSNHSEWGQPQKTSFRTGWTLTFLLENSESWVLGLSPAEKRAGKEAVGLPAASLCQGFLTAQSPGRVLQAETDEEGACRRLLGPPVACREVFLQSRA